MLTYAGACWRMLEYAGVCWSMVALKYPNHRQTGFDFRFRFPRKDLKDQAPKTESDKQAQNLHTANETSMLLTKHLC